MPETQQTYSPSLDKRVLQLQREAETRDINLKLNEVQEIARLTDHNQARLRLSEWYVNRKVELGLADRVYKSERDQKELKSIRSFLDNLYSHFSKRIKC